MAFPQGIERATIKRVSHKAIHAGWDELLRVVASIRVGKIGAELAPRLPGSVALWNPLGRARHSPKPCNR
ncbi:Tn3 family transposase [Variovorax humicola]|uniref:Tn3 family transposase n=1 Tax=Variovorax humicola TaxID=1769758 RepID=UPI003BF545A9